MQNFKYIVVGAGFFGSTIAERIASVLDSPVLVIEKRSHIGGNCYSENDSDTGILYHVYGTHIFHTSNNRVWEYLNKFTEFNTYYHQVLTTYNNKVYQMPINLETINSFYNTNLKPYEVKEFLKKEIPQFNHKNLNFEEKAISQIGKKLYAAFVKGYTKKQWQKDPCELPEEVFNRLPIRYNYNESYFFDKWQGVPIYGFTPIFNKLLSNSKIKVLTNTDYFQIKDSLNKDAVVFYSGSMDSFFDYKYGTLEYRSLKFEKEILPYFDFQGTSVMNYANEEIPYTRIHEPRHLHPERNEFYPQDKTLIIKEYSKSDDGASPYYPVNNKINESLFLQYKEESLKNNNVFFGGRLGSYKYFDMEKTIENALALFEYFLEKQKGS